MDSLILAPAPRTQLVFAAEIAALLPSLRARATRLTHSRVEADDLLQETALRALRFESTFERGTNLKAWMHRILESIFISGCRRRQRERSALGRFAEDPTLAKRSVPEPAPRVVSNKMDTALRSLPDKFRDVVALVDLRDHTYREAADELGIPVGTVMSRLFRARRMLSIALTPESELSAAA
jgi:RNA polymerase sigma-70 factor (ECF subfamily)